MQLESDKTATQKINVSTHQAFFETRQEIRQSTQLGIDAQSNLLHEMNELLLRSRWPHHRIEGQSTANINFTDEDLVSQSVAKRSFPRPMRIINLLK